MKRLTICGKNLYEPIREDNMNVMDEYSPKPIRRSKHKYIKKDDNEVLIQCLRLLDVVSYSSVLKVL